MLLLEAGQGQFVTEEANIPWSSMSSAVRALPDQLASLASRM